MSSYLTRVVCFLLATAVLTADGQIMNEQCAEGKVRNFPDSVLPKNGGQLSSGFGSEFVIDRDVGTELRDNYHCAHTKIEENNTPWWLINLEETEIIDQVIIAVPSQYPVLNVGIGSNFMDAVKNSKGTADQKYNCQKFKSNHGFIEFDCGGQRGQFVAVTGEKNVSLIMCEVQVLTITIPSKNIAEGKPTNQSSVSYSGISSLAVDGNEISNGHYYNNLDELEPQCTHTNDDGEDFPWWSVDLLEEYIVDSVTLHNRGEGLETRLHDFEIRVGNSNIEDYGSEDRRFKKNPVCASYEDRFVEAEDQIICLNPLLGRYVSVQIFKPCTMQWCEWTSYRSKGKNVLTLCEVQVFGVLPKQIHHEKINVALHSTLHHFNEDTQLQTEEIMFPWFYVYLGGPAVIDATTITWTSATEGGDIGPVPDFEIRIGNYPITSKYDNELFRRNILCYRMKNGSFKSGENELKCLQPLFGRYVTLQVTEPCNNKVCRNKLDMFLELNIKAWGFRDLVSVTLKSEGKLTSQSSTFQNGMSSLAVDGQFPKTLLTPRSISYCAQTQPEKHPWWHLGVWPEILIEEVVVYLPENGNVHFRDFEILVTNEHIEGRLRNDDFKSTPEMVCAISEDRIYPEGENRFKCKTPIEGTFIAIRIANDKNDNILNICEVEVLGCRSPEELLS